MFEALLSFFGGAVFRTIWGEVAAFVSKQQDHKHELEMLKLQAELSQTAKAQDLEIAKTQHALGVETVRIQADAAVSSSEADAWSETVKSLGRTTGIWFIDAWNGAIRPAIATVCVGLWIGHVHTAGWKLDDPSWAIMSAALGLYLADRALFKRGK